MWILIYYNSLPDMPKGCALFSNDIMHRDHFTCNPKNTGHYKYPCFEDLSYDAECHEKEVPCLLEKDGADKFVVFYTRHMALDAESRNVVMGYFKVGKHFIRNGKKGFRASESVLLRKKDCIPIEYRSRGVPTSWGKSAIRPKVDKILERLRTEDSISIADRYQEETRAIMRRMRTPAGRKKVISLCEGCTVKKDCYWGRKRRATKERVLEKLHGKENSCGEKARCAE